MMPVSGRRRGGAALPANTDKILELVFTGRTALAGLILVFLGAVFTSYDSYQPEQQADVAIKYKNRALISLIGISRRCSMIMRNCCRSTLWLIARPRCPFIVRSPSASVIISVSR